MSTFTLVIHGAPYSSQSALSGLNFCKAVLESGHAVYRLFFYQDGVHNASALVVPPQDEFDLPRAWQQLIQAHNLDAVVCVASALKRGILSEEEATRHERKTGNVLGGFKIGGLGQLVDATIVSDRVLNFSS